MKVNLVSALLFFSFEAKADAQLANVIERVIDGVVNIRVSYPVETSEAQIEAEILKQKSIDKFFELFMLPGKIFRGQARASGSGFFYDTQGTIVTNYHVIQDAKRIEVISTHAKKSYEAKLVGFDKKADIALLKIKSVEKNQRLQFGDAQSLRIGEDVFAIGNPFGYGHTVTRGILSAKNRTIGAGPFDDFLQTDAAINPGNSGGPLFNSKGEVVGINKATSAEGHGISFAIPSDVALPIIRRILGDIKNTKVWMGVIPTNLSEDKSVPGIFVQNLVKDSPAVQSGLKVGDIILKVNNQSLNSVTDFKRLLPVYKESAGKVKLNIFRRGQKLDLEIKGNMIAQSKAGENSF